MTSRKKPSVVRVFRGHSFTQKEALALLRAHVGLRGLVERRAKLDERFYYPNGYQCLLLYWNGIGNVTVLGEGASWRQAFEDAGVFFENGESYRI